MRRITSRQNPHIQHIAQLASTTAARRESGTYWAEGIHLVQEAFAVIPSDIIELIVAEEAQASAQIAALLKEAQAWPEVIVTTMPMNCYQKCSALKSPEGIAAVCRTSTPDEHVFFHPNAKLVALAGVQDPGNAGAIVRTAAAAGMEGVLFLDHCVDATHPALLRAAMGAAFRIPIGGMSEEAFLECAKKTGLHLCGAVLKDAVPCDQADWRLPVCVVIGSEGMGIPASLEKELSRRVFIPMDHGVESLNAAVATGILLYALRQSLASQTS